MPSSQTLDVLPKATDIQAAEILADPAWFLSRIDWDANRAIFTLASRQELSGQVFLGPRDWRMQDLPQEARSLGEIQHARVSAPPALLLWHTSFCCSTLIADCLDIPGRCLALKEPGVLAEIAEARLAGAPGANLQFVRNAMALLSRRFAPDERVLIKPGNAANPLARHIVPQVARSVFLYSSCRDFICSVVAGGPIAGGGELRRKLARTLLTRRLLSRESEPNWPPQEAVALTDLEVAAALWHLQIAEFHQARAACPGGGMTLDCDAFLARPDQTLFELGRFLGLGLDGADIAAVMDGPKVRRSAKQPEVAFDGRRRRESLDEAARALGPALDEVVAWSYAVCGTPPGPDPFAPARRGN